MEAEVDEGTEISKGVCEADVSVGNRYICCLGKFVLGVIVSFPLSPCSGLIVIGFPECYTSSACSSIMVFRGGWCWWGQEQEQLG